MRAALWVGLGLAAGIPLGIYVAVVAVAENFGRILKEVNERLMLE